MESNQRQKSMEAHYHHIISPSSTIEVSIASSYLLTLLLIFLSIQHNKMGPPDHDTMDIDTSNGVEESKQSGVPKPEVSMVAAG